MTDRHMMPGADPDEGTARPPLSITPAGLIGSILLLAVVLVFLRLGFWQLARLGEQREINAGMAARMEEPPVLDASALADTAGVFYRRVSLAGTFDHDRSIILPGRSRLGLPGVHLLTPLRLPDREAAVLVNRGWVPAADATTIELSDFEIDSATITGLVLPFPGRAQSLTPRARASAEGDGFRRVWYAIDEDALRRQYPYPLLPVTVQTLPDSLQAARDQTALGRGAGGAPVGRSVSSYPAPLPPPPLDDGPHLGYALQWFSFALIGVIGWVALFLRSRHRQRRAPPDGPPLANPPSHGAPPGG